jgi:hypothetical protein
MSISTLKADIRTARVDVHGTRIRHMAYDEVSKNPAR